MSNTEFSCLNLKPDLFDNLASLGYVKMTPIQAQSLPLILDGKDVIAQGKTGSGKTAVFGLGLLQNLNVKTFAVQSLVLCPTRELADQVAAEIRRLARGIHNIKVLTLCGGKPFGPQLGSLEHGAHIIVGTPGRIEEHLIKGSLVLDQLNTFVLDEADRMLDMGFQAALEAIFSFTPAKRQTLLLSATFPPQIESIANQIMQQPQTVKVESLHDKSSIRQHLYQVNNNEDRVAAVRLLLLDLAPESAIIFCNTKVETRQVADELKRCGFDTKALHGDLEQRDRDDTLVQFANKSISLLVATDVAARGLDIDDIDAVINFGIARDIEVHIHRIGRTGRSGSKGAAYTIVSKDEDYKVARLEAFLQQTIPTEALPDTVLLSVRPYKPKMCTLFISAGKKQKIRPGDIVGALTGENGIEANDIGVIKISAATSYVAITRDVAKKALDKLANGKLKGKSIKVRRL